MLNFTRRKSFFYPFELKYGKKTFLPGVSRGLDKVTALGMIYGLKTLSSYY